MAQQMHLVSVVDLPPKMWAQIASYSIKKIRERTRSGYGINDSDSLYGFPKYSKAYAEAKSEGMKGRGGLKGFSIDRQTAPPNFSLRTLTMKSLNILQQAKDFITIGWKGEFAEIVSTHEDRGKYKVGGIAGSEFEGVLDIVGRQLDENWNRKVKNMTVTVKA